MSGKVTDREVVIPRLPRSSAAEISPRYIDQLVTALENAIDVLNSTRQRNFTSINLANTQEHGAGLRTGDVFTDSGILKIAQTGHAYADTFVGTTSIGTVTVSTP
tara:strand:- start:691 stop:1005 length:315 start_codon:yes stop_codon:yes gene_type:complete